MDQRPAIVVVDDEVEICNLLAEWLGEAGYGVQAAADPAFALSLLERAPMVDLLLTDVVMPGGLSGFDLARRARAQRPDLKVMFISGYSMAQTVQRARDTNEPILRKPFRHHELMAEVSRVLASRARL